MTARPDTDARLDPTAALATATVLGDAATIIVDLGTDIVAGAAALGVAGNPGVPVWPGQRSFEHRARAIAGSMSALSRDLAADATTLRGAAADAVRADTGIEPGTDAMCRPPELERGRGGDGLGWWRSLWNGAVNRSVSVGIDTLYAAVDLWGPARLGAVDPAGMLSPLLLGALGQNPTGDPAGTYSSRRVETMAGSAATEPSDQGRNTIHRLLEATGDLGRVRADEFAVVDHGANRYSVVLPGVTDLAVPNTDLHLLHRSVRDLNRFAVPSAASSRLADNEYGRMVAEGLHRLGVPPGAELLLVGHSYGADTALDLAADAGFNGGLYRVSHVVAAGYHSEPQLADVQPNTEVLVLQNRRDLVVGVESLLDRLTFDEPGPVPTGRIVHSEFDGGLGADLGHGQERYTSFVDRADGPGVLAFYRSVASAGYAGDGAVVAIDVSVPR